MSAGSRRHRTNEPLPFHPGAAGPLSRVSRGYYACQQVKQQVVTQLGPAWETKLVKVFGVHKRCYGTRRLRVELRRKGYRVGRQRLHIAIRRWGLHALQPKACTPRTTDSTHGLRCALKCLLNQPKPTLANRLWGSDIT